jgi:hypothetical protein
VTFTFAAVVVVPVLLLQDAIPTTMMDAISNARALKSFFIENTSFCLLYFLYAMRISAD